MRSLTWLALVALGWLGSATQARGAEPDRAARRALNARFSHFDLNQDGLVEIERAAELRLGPDAGPAPRGTVLLLVDPRLLAGPARALPSLLPALCTYAADLARDGWRVVAVSMQVYAGPVHQDGRTLLAMREYLRGLKALCPDLAGAVLLGSFPEAMLVRQYNWRQREPTVLHAGQTDEERFGNRPVYRIRSVPEMVAGRCELVLADLDGNWEWLYHPGPEDVPRALAVYPNATPPAGGAPLERWLSGGPTPHLETGSERFSDFFLVNDGRYLLTHPKESGAALYCLDDLQDDECSAADRRRGNPLARPDLLISRLDASHIALHPKTSLHGAKGERLLDTSSKPQRVSFAGEKETPRGLSVWEPDPVLERRLLIEYFERNHRYRQGAFRQQLRPAAAAYGLGSPMGEMCAARPEWKSLGSPDYDVSGEPATLPAVVEWLKRPALLRAICAHSDPWGANFAATKDVAGLERACGGQPWSWVRRGKELVPTLGATGKLDFAITRTLWQNGALPDTANFFLHWGCEATSPGGAMSVPYHHPEYAYWQGAEGLLFYCKGLALVGRSKVFYDFPRGFVEELAAGKTFGEAWAHYYEVESAETDVERAGGGIGRKRSYFWGVLGDWTLHL